MQKYLGFVIVLLLLLSGAAHAADPYVVTGVQVDVTADTAPKARDQAIREAHHKAFETLAGQLFPGKPVPKVSDKTLGNMVSDFRVEQEQVAANRYVASFTFRFRQNQVRAAFNGRGVMSPQQLAAKASGAPDSEMPMDDSSIDQIIASEKPIDPNTDLAEAVSVTPIPGESILVQVTAHNSRELDQALARFKDVDLVREIEYVSITPDKSILRLAYAGAPDQLLSQIHLHNISLRADNTTTPPLYILEP